MMLLPPKPGTCPICAHDHPPDYPHNCQSIYYQMRFYGVRGRWPTWADAIAHCVPELQEMWKHELGKRGAWTEPEDGEPIADPPAESFTQTIGDPNSGKFGPSEFEPNSG